MCGAINASVTEKACVCQLLNMGHRAFRTVRWEAGGQLPYKSLTSEMLHWSSPALTVTLGGVNGGEFSWRVGPDTRDVTPPPIRLAAEAAENRRQTVPSGFFACLNLLHPLRFLSRWRQNGVVQHRPEEHKKFYHKPGSSVCHI